MLYCVDHSTPQEQAELDRELHEANTMYGLGRHLLQNKQALQALPLVQQALTSFIKVCNACACACVCVFVCVGERRGDGEPRLVSRLVSTTPQQTQYACVGPCCICFVLSCVCFTPSPFVLLSQVYGRKHPRVGFAFTTLASCHSLEGSQKKLRRALTFLER